MTTATRCDTQVQLELDTPIAQQLLFAKKMEKVQENITKNMTMTHRCNWNKTRPTTATCKKKFRKRCKNL